MGNICNTNHWNEDRIDYIIECTKKAIEVGKFKDKYAIISIGSGTGKYEKIIMEKCFPSDIENPKLICVDKLTESYPDEEMIIKPHFSDVDALLDTHPEFIENCIMLLFWPYDQGHMNEYSFPNQTPYDIDALAKLKPRSVVIMYEEFGGAGSTLLHAWISNYTYLHSNLHYYEDIDIVNSMIPYNKYQYKFIKKNKWHYGEPDAFHFNEKSIICGLFVLKDDINEPYTEHPLLLDVPDENDVKLCIKKLSNGSIRNAIKDKEDKEDKKDKKDKNKIEEID